MKNKYLIYILLLTIFFIFFPIETFAIEENIPEEETILNEAVIEEELPQVTVEAEEQTNLFTDEASDVSTPEEPMVSVNSETNTDTPEEPTAPAEPQTAEENTVLQFAAVRTNINKPIIQFTIKKIDGISKCDIYQEGVLEPVATISSQASAGTEVKTTISNESAANYYAECLVNEEILRSEIVSVEAMSLPLPAAPSKVTAYSSLKKVKLEWTEVPEATSYVIYRKTGKDGEYIKRTTVQAPKHNFTDNVEIDKKYTYRVYAQNKNGISEKYASTKGEAFRKIHYKITFAHSKTLTSNKHKRTRFKVGFKASAIDYKNGQYIFKYKGHEYKISRILAQKQKVSQISPDKMYSVKEVKDFINEAKLTSRTKYLIFVSTYTQHEYVFKGKKGNWKLVWHDDIATGRASTPTPTGLTRIESKYPKENGLKYWSCCYVFSIHGLPRGAKVNYPTSGACVRNYDKRAKWVYDNCPIGTAVYVY